MASELADIGLATFKKVADIWKAGRADSLIEFTQPTRVEPIVLIDAAALVADSLPEVLQTLLSLYSGYYLQAVSLLATINNVKVIGQLEKLSPNRNVIDSALSTAAGGGGWTMIAESYKDMLPKPSRKPSAARELAMEAGLVGVDKNAAATAKELTNLAVGKLLNVELTDGGDKKAIIPVNVRLITSSVPTSSLVHILTQSTADKSTKERWHGIRSGRLRAIADGVLCLDLITAHRKALMADKDGAYSVISKRGTDNALASMITANPSVATASNMVVLTQGSVLELEQAMNGRLSDFRTREKMLAGTTVMLIAVIDPRNDRVTFYHRSIPKETEVGVRDLKISNKSGPDVSDILKAYSLGNPPAL